MSIEKVAKRKQKADHDDYLDTQIQKVVDYLEDECDIVVEFGGKINAFYYEDDLIAISNKQSVNSKLFTLLHEAGHYLLREENKNMFPTRSGGRRETKGYRVEVLHEEFLAWDRGLELAGSLGVKVDPVTWKKITHKHLYDYISWAKNPREFRRKNVRK